MPTGEAELEILEMLATLDGPAVLAGDLNTLPWSRNMARLRSITGTELAGPLRSTLRHAKLPIPLPLDYALSPEGGTVIPRPLYGSDHRGIVAELSLASD